MPTVVVPSLTVCEPISVDAQCTLKTSFVTTTCYIRALNVGNEEHADHHVDLGVRLAFNTHSMPEE